MTETTLTERATQWVQQQPEYPLLFLTDRRTRRRASTMLARVFFTLPTSGPVEMTRKERRELTKEMQRAIGKARTKMSRRQQRMLTQAVRQRNRYGRLSARRLAELAAREAERAELEAAEEHTAAALAKAAEDAELYGSTDPALD